MKNEGELPYWEKICFVSSPKEYDRHHCQVTTKYNPSCKNLTQFPAVWHRRGFHPILWNRHNGTCHVILTTQIRREAKELKHKGTSRNIVSSCTIEPLTLFSLFSTFHSYRIFTVVPRYPRYLILKKEKGETYLVRKWRKKRTIIEDGDN